MYGNVTATNSITVAGTFVLNLNKPMPVCMSLINSIQAVTQAQCTDVTRSHPLLSLITQHASGGLADSANSKGLFVVSISTLCLCLQFLFNNDFYWLMLV